MTRYADPERCPDCLAAMPYGAPECPACGLTLVGPLGADLFSTLSHADRLLVAMRSGARTVPVAPGGPAGRGAPGAGRGADTAGDAPGESSGGGLADLFDGAVAPLTHPRTAGHPARFLTSRLQPRAATGSSAGSAGSARAWLSAASVPRILLALGALCLLVAALVFLAVTWSAMGVAARTATLVAVTVVAAALDTWAARRDLRAAAESLTVVALGLLAFDLVGARDSGWLGAIGTPAFLVVLGTALVVAGSSAADSVRRTPVRDLLAAQAVAALGAACAVTGFVATTWLPFEVDLTIATPLLAVVALAAARRRLTALAVGATTLGVLSWSVLAASATVRVLESPSLPALWLDREVWPLLSAMAIAGAVALARGLPTSVRLTALSLGSLLLWPAVLAPVIDASSTTLVVTGAALLAVLGAAALAVPAPWRRSIVAAGAVGLFSMAAVTVGLTGSALLRIAEAGALAWSGEAGDTFGPAPTDAPAGWALPLVVASLGLALVAAARSFPFADAVISRLAHRELLAALSVVVTAVALTMHPSAMWLVLAVLLAGGAGCLASALARQDLTGVAVAVPLLGTGLLLALHAPWLTFAAVAAVLGAALAVYLRARHSEVRLTAGMVVAGAFAGLVWTVGSLASAPEQWVAATALLVLAVVVLVAPYVDRPLRAEQGAGRVGGDAARIGLEVGALMSAAALTVAGLAAPALADHDTEAAWLAVYLTLVGAAVSTVALVRADRRPAIWLGGFLLASASWVRLADLGVDAPEAYTVPSATALLLAGLLHLRRHPEARTTTALSPGLGLALVPSLLWSLEDPLSLRAVLLGAACLALVLGAVTVRWSAPLVHGAAVGAVLVLRLATPMAEGLPRWALIGAAGIALLAVGITWESRVRDARAVAGYVRVLR